MAAGNTEHQHRSLGPDQPAEALDGLRGIACGLVVLSHAWIIVPDLWIDRAGPARGVLRSGSLGVMVFMVMGAFLVTRSLLARDGPGWQRVAGFWRRRLVRLGAHLVVLLATVTAVAAVDRWDTYTRAVTVGSTWSIATFTFNWRLVNDPLGSRDDLGHLWYLSAEQQYYVVLVLALAFFGRYRRALSAALVAMVVSAAVWRLHIFETDGWWAASLMTSTRCDGLALGSFAALWMAARPPSRYARLAAAMAASAAAGLILLSARLDDTAFLGWQGATFGVATVVLVGALTNPERQGRAARALSIAPLRGLGRIAYPVYLWHLPIFYAATRWARWVDWRLRATLAGAALVAIVAVVDRFVERPTAAWLRKRQRGAIETATAIESPSRPGAVSAVE